jgi:hypothetical protein
VEIDYLSTIFSLDKRDDNLIFVDLASVISNDNEFTQLLKNELKAKNRLFSVIENATEQSIQQSIVFEKEKTNIVIFNTDKYSGIYPFLSFLNLKSKEYDIQLFEQYSWKNQNTQVKFKTLSIAPFKPLITNDDLDQYNRLFKNSFGWKKSSSNPQYDVLGYDIGNYFIALLYEFGPNFSLDRTKLPLASGLQSFLRFDRLNTTSGFVNKQLYQH